MFAFSERRRIQGAIPFQPCLPRAAIAPPVGVGWVHEIKHDGFRIVARRVGDRVRLFTRNGYDFTTRFPKIAAAVAALPVRSWVVDGEAIVVNREGLSVFDLLRFRQTDHAAVLCAFDLIELDGKDLLADLLRGTSDGIAFNTHFAGDGATIFEHACALGCEGIVSKRLGSPYRSGRVDHWFKIKNPVAPAARREVDEDWGNRRGTRGGSRHRRHPLRYYLTEAGE
jgi:bifunctional non-homologous end joining protein LigD